VNRRGLVLAGLRHHWRTQAGVGAGTAVTAAVLVGGLSVGDSVSATLRRGAVERVGRVECVLAAEDRLFRADLATELAADHPNWRVAPLLHRRAVATGGAARVADAHVLGIDRRFLESATKPFAGPPPGPGETIIGDVLARRLGVSEGDEILLRVHSPGDLPADLVLARTDDLTAGFRVRVRAILAPAAGGRFGLEARPRPAANAFVELQWLQQELKSGPRANLMVAWSEQGDLAPQDADAALRARVRIEDAQLGLRQGPGYVELRSGRVFLDEPVGRAAAELGWPAVGLLTYFVNELRSGARATPYSTVCAAGPLDGDFGNAAWRGGGWPRILPDDAGPGEVVVGSWLQEDLALEPGASIALRYTIPGPDRRLAEAQVALRVRGVTPLEGPAADPSLLPEIPGLSDAGHCRDWEPGIPIELDRIRDADEAYWNEHRGTPKAFLPLAAGQELWANRFGRLTAVRFAGAAPAEIGEALRARLDPASIGLRFADLRGAALSAAAASTDFGGLFLGLSAFIIASALLLTALLFAFGAEQRAGEIGALLALGWRRRQVAGAFLAEGALVAVAGAAAGTALGTGYTSLVLLCLRTVWRDAAGFESVSLSVRPVSLVLGAGAAVAAAVGSMALVLRALMRRPAAELLRRRLGSNPLGGRGRPRASAAMALVAGLAGVAVLAGGAGAARPAPAFFVAGALLLLAALAGSRLLIGHLGARAATRRLTPATLARRGAGRRPGRSLAAVTLLACGTFLIVAVGANRPASQAELAERGSGTGGFALFAESTLPVVHDLESAEGRADLGLPAGFDVVPLRARAGDDASCLNLSRVERPRLVGVDPRALSTRGAFRFARVAEPADDPWLLLEGPGPQVPAIGDHNSVTWSMHKRVGDTIDYVDERGRPFRVRIVATVASSILQGDLLIARAAFEERFPGESGFRMFLIDAAPESAGEVARALGAALRQEGIEITPAAERLAEFEGVQATYLSIFQILGGLGLLLGSAGLGMVVLRNVLERRGELALMTAVGLERRLVGRVVQREHVLLLLLGVGCGGGAALVAVGPALGSGAAGAGLVQGALLAAGVVASGWLWVALATRVALRGNPIRALRAE
jgi:ABC-type lipoprotein release transport system permease subunit